MLVNFIGSPCSGKTTVAALLFALLKDSGYAAEFLPEQARLYISRRRVEAGLDPRDGLLLNDYDQLSIIHQQFEQESILEKACGKSVVIISDSTPLNCLLYMTPECRNSYTVQSLVSKYKEFKSLNFWLHPIEESERKNLDPLRVHDRLASLEIEAQIPEMLSQTSTQAIALYGSSTERCAQAQKYVLSQVLQS